MLKNRRILITGAAGSIGSEIVRQLCKKNKVLGVDYNETGIWDLKEELDIEVIVGDIRDEKVLEEAFEFKPHYVFHAAALKHVTPLEIRPKDAVDTNIYPTLNLIRLCQLRNAKFVYVSTDKAVNPSCIMGASKLFGEVATINAGFNIVRFGNVMNSRGSVIPIWQRQINQGRPLTVTDDRMERFMMTIEEAAELIIKAAEIKKWWDETTGRWMGNKLILDMGKPIRVIDMAKRFLEEARLNLGIKITGARPGEKLTERLMNEDERERAKPKGKFFVIAKI